MFARTARLMLRPGWPEDALALTHAIAHEAVAMNLGRLPWPYHLDDAQTFLALPPASDAPRLLIFDDPAGRPRLVGGIGITADDADGPELGYWLTPDGWGRGYATEAGAAVLAIARDAIGLKQLHARHHVDNPASGRVLAKLGFRPVGRGPRWSVAQGREVECELLALDLSERSALQLAA